MIDPPLPERKVDYWRTIFNAVVPDDNNGIVIINNKSLLLTDSSYFSCYENPSKPPLSEVRGGSETCVEIQPGHASPAQGGEAADRKMI